MRRMLLNTMTAKNTMTQDPPRLDAALVYRDQDEPDRWVVGPPAQSADAQQAFTGPNACIAALEYAHRQYGSARFFSS